MAAREPVGVSPSAVCHTLTAAKPRCSPRSVLEVVAVSPPPRSPSARVEEKPQCVTESAQNRAAPCSRAARSDAADTGGTSPFPRPDRYHRPGLSSPTVPGHTPWGTELDAGPLRFYRHSCMSQGDPELPVFWRERCRERPLLPPWKTSYFLCPFHPRSPLQLCFVSDSRFQHSGIKKICSLPWGRERGVSFLKTGEHSPYSES